MRDRSHVTAVTAVTGTRSMRAGNAAELVALADKVERLAPPSRRDPERFWRDKSDLAYAIRLAAKGLRNG